MPSDVKIALIGMASGLLTLLIGEVFRRWRSAADRKRDEAQNANLDADTEHKTMDALTAAFRAIADRQAGDISDLQGRLRRVEDALLLTQQRNDSLSAENEELRGEVRRLREDRDGCRARAEQLEGELRQLKQLSASATRVYGQDETPADGDDPPETQQ